MDNLVHMGQNGSICFKLNISTSSRAQASSPCKSHLVPSQAWVLTLSPNRAEPTQLKFVFLQPAQAWASLEHSGVNCL